MAFEWDLWLLCPATQSESPAIKTRAAAQTRPDFWATALIRSRPLMTEHLQWKGETGQEDTQANRQTGRQRDEPEEKGREKTSP